MAEAVPHLPDPLDAHLAALANAAAILEWPLPRERDEATCHELAGLVDALLVRVARGRGALDIAVGEALDVLSAGARVCRLGHSGIGDHARERLGIAERISCVALRRQLQHGEDTRMCARGEFEVWAPRRVAAVIAQAFSAARKAAGRWISAGECLTRIAEHFIEVWEPALRLRNTLQKQVLERDKGLCTVPWCSKAADHAHHIEYRSRGGSDDLSNQTSLCSVHHLQGIHMGRLRVWGSAPDQLHWEVVEPLR
jgi:hypothetical protein